MSIAMRKRSVKTAAHTFAASLSDDGQAVVHFFASLDTSKSLAACLLFKYGEHVQLLDLDVNPSDYLDYQGDLFHRDYLAISFLSKNESLKTGYDKKARGLEKFAQFEQQCKETNHRFRSYAALEKTAYATWLFTMRRKIDLILGDFDADQMFNMSAWGPGVTTLLKGEDTSATRKFQSEIGMTRDAYALMGSSMAAAYPGWFREERASDSSIQIQAGNTITTVPKNSKIDRIIAIEPGLNLFFQKGVGQMIKSRMVHRGVDLKHQTANQQKARQGSIDGSLATVDFSSASDSIAKKIVEHLVPSDWYEVMNALRCKSGSFEGNTVHWEKFSSMGNGFTWELESLIFYAAALTTCEHLQLDAKDVGVYGDDVIIPNVAYEGYRKFCEFLGFSVNTDKSFSSGVFRESCGAHYFRGLDVKPIFHRKTLSDAFSVYKLANSIRRLSHRRNLGYGCDLRFLGTWRRILQGLPLALRSVRIPDGYGDGGVLSNFDEAVPPRAGFGLEGFSVLMLSQRGVQKHQNCAGLLQERLTQIIGSPEFYKNRRESDGNYRLSDGLSSLAYGNDTTLRGRTTLGVSQVLVFEWYDLGGWV